MQEMTTQKHDFVSKFQYRRLKILPKDNIKKLCGCIEKETTQRLSFMPNCIVGKQESFKPIITYKKSESNFFISFSFVTFKSLLYFFSYQFQWSLKRPKN